MNEVDQIKQKIDIVDYIGQFVSLKNAGRNFKGLCPFHSEKSPSFMVSAERQIWHCFGCQKGGDIFSFLMEYEKLDFSESLKTLAAQAGVTLSGPIYKTEQEKKKDTVYTLNTYAAQYYHYLLTQHKVGKKALEYLTENRQLPMGLIEKFQLGYAPQTHHALANYLTKRHKQSPDSIIEAGLASAKYGKTYDFFFHRIIFPIHDSRGNIIAFSGRALDNETMPKYINTRETAVYKKSQSLFGIYFAKEAIKKENKVLIVEGEFDVITSFKEGIQNVVALKGTALTDEQIKLVKRYASKILFCFDTDIAGTAAQKRSIAMLEKEGLASSVIVPPEGKDPDELLRESPHLFKKALKEEINVYDFLISAALKANNVATPEGKRAVLDETLPILSGIDNEVIKEHYLKKLAELLHASYDSVLKQSSKKKLPPPPAVAKKSKPSVPRETIAEQYLLSLIFQSKNPDESVKLLTRTFQDVSFSTESLNSLLQELKKYMEDKNFFELAPFAQQLPAELVDSFDACCLTPIFDFETEEDFQKELKKVLTDTFVLAVHSKLKELSEAMQTLEQDHEEEKLASIQQEYTNVTALLHNTQKSLLD